MSKHLSLETIEQELRRQNGGTIPSDEFIIHKAVEEEVKRLQEILYLVIGETRFINEEVFTFRAWDVLLAFGRLVIKTNQRPNRLVLARRSHMPAWALALLIWLWEEFTGPEPVDLDNMIQVLKAHQRQQVADLTPELMAFVELIQLRVQEERYPELAKITPELLASLALRRWEYVGVAVRDTASGTYDLSDMLKRATQPEREVAATMLGMPEVECFDPKTGRFRIRPRFAM